MATHQELRDLAMLRLKEAECLFQNKFYDGCFYLCGYVLELALKARICKVLALDEYPPSAPKPLGSLFMTHDFDALRVLARIDDDLARDHQLLVNWSLATEWTPQIRYQVRRYDLTEAREMLASLTAPRVGVLTWLKKRW